MTSQVGEGLDYKYSFVYAHYLTQYFTVLIKSLDIDLEIRFVVEYHHLLINLLKSKFAQENKSNIREYIFNIYIFI